MERLLSLFFGFIVAATFMIAPLPSLFGGEFESIIQIISSIISLILGIMVLIESFRCMKL